MNRKLSKVISEPESNIKLFGQMLVKFNPQGSLFHKRLTHKHIARIEVILDYYSHKFWIDIMDEYLETSLSGKDS